MKVEILTIDEGKPAFLCLPMSELQMERTMQRNTLPEEAYDEALIRKMIEKVTVYEEKFAVEFKAGISLEIKR